MSITAVDTLSLLALLASPLFVGLMSTAAENWVWFQSINANGRFAVIAVLSALLGMASIAAQKALAANPALLADIDPYLIVALPAINFFVSQIVHGTESAKEKGVATAAAARSVSPR